MKASRCLTHVKRLVDIEQGLHRFYEPLAPLRHAGRLAAVLWQLPASFHRDELTLAQLLGRPARRRLAQLAAGA